MAVARCGGGAVSSAVDRMWRFICTGLAFASLGLGGVAMAVTIFPVVTLLTHDPVVRQRRVQGCVRASFRLYVLMLRTLGVLSLNVGGREELTSSRGKLIVANHPSLLDVVLLMSLIPRVQCVVKHELWHNPFLGPVVRAAGYIRNDTPAEELIAVCAETLREGNNLVIFPEGTRSVPGQPVRLQRGFANIATLIGADILAVTILCEPPTLRKGEPWYRIPAVRPTFSISAGDVISVRRSKSTEERPMAARRLVAALETYYSERLVNGRSGA